MWSWFLVHLCEMMIAPGAFFSFSKFWLLGRAKGQKMVQNDEKFCLLHSISEKPYIRWLSCVVNICKMIISSSVLFHFFKILIFWVHRGVKTQKMVHNDKNFCLWHSISQESSAIWLYFWFTSVKWWCWKGGSYAFGRFWQLDDAVKGAWPPFFVVSFIFLHPPLFEVLLIPQ